MTPAVLIYDGACRLCREGVAWIARRAAPGAFEFLPCQAPERRARYPWLEERACLEAMQLVLADGRVLPGHQAIPEILGRLRGWRWLAGLFRVPGVRRLAPSLYAWVARHRHRISARMRGGPRG